MVKYGTNVGQRLAGPRTRRDDEVLAFAGSAQLDGLYLMPIQRIAFEDAGDIGMKHAFVGKVHHSADYLDRIGFFIFPVPEVPVPQG